MKPIRVAVLCDYPEEGWPSMDLTGEMILVHLRQNHAETIRAERVCPPFRTRFGRLSSEPRRGFSFNADRILNRQFDYPAYLRKLHCRGEFDVYHIVDHSYAQLVHALPAGRTVVTCHDLDTFRCLLEPEAEPRPFWFRLMTQRTLSGLRRAAAVTCDSDATLRAVLKHELLPADRLKTVYLGTHPECSPDPDPEADRRVEQLLGPKGEHADELLHVGSNIPRKRIDVLLRTFAGVREARPQARLIKVGGAFTPEQDRLARELRVIEQISFLPYFSPVDGGDRATLAALYRRADVLLQTSDAEGFGLPLAEAMACGTPIVASDIPVLREVAGDWARYAEVGDIPGWVAATRLCLDAPRPEVNRSMRFRWSRHVNDLVQIYRLLAEGAV